MTINRRKKLLSLSILYVFTLHLSQPWYIQIKFYVIICTLGTWPIQSKIKLNRSYKWNDNGMIIIFGFIYKVWDKTRTQWLSLISVRGVIQFAMIKRLKWNYNVKNPTINTNVVTFMYSFICRYGVLDSDNKTKVVCFNQ